MSSLRPGFRARAAAESGSLFGGGCYLEFEVVISSAPESGMLFGEGYYFGRVIIWGGVNHSVGFGFSNGLNFVWIKCERIHTGNKT